MNKVVLVGRLVKDPELRFTPGEGKAVATFTLAVNRRFKPEEADFLPIVVWGKQAENCANYLGKGSQASIAGEIHTRSYDAKDGTKRYVTEIIANEVQFLDSKVKNSNNNSGSNSGSSSNSGSGSENNSSSNSFEEYEDNDITPIDDGDIPF